mgnify:CR=1 FL=1
MTEGDLLFLFSAQGLAVGAVVHGGTVHHGISTLTAFQTAAKPNQMVRKTTMPIMAPLSDLVGVTRQTAVLALQYGDGFSNIFYPVSGYFMATLALGHVPYGKWMKKMAPLFIIWTVLAAAFMVIAQLIKWGPF